MRAPAYGKSARSQGASLGNIGLSLAYAFGLGLLHCTEAVPTPNCGDFADQSCWHPIRAGSRTSVCYNAGFTEQARATTSFHMQSDWFVDFLNQ